MPMMKYLIAGGVGAFLIVGGGAYVYLTRPDNGPTKYQRADVLNLEYLSMSVPAEAGDRNTPSKLALKLNLILTETANVRVICRQTRVVKRAVSQSLTQHPIHISSNNKTDFDKIKPDLLKAVIKAVKSNQVVDLDYGLSAGSTLVAYPRYLATKIGCPSRVSHFRR
jgi:hypothetical protein